MEIMERKEAANNGSTKYFTGRKCKKGHLTHRYTASGNCSKCSSMRGAQYSKKLRAAKTSAGLVDFNRVVPARLVGVLNAVIAADKLNPPPCPNGCHSGAFCMACDTAGW